MRVLVACERSGVVRRAFRALGHDAWSCDLEPADDGSPYHLKVDAVRVAHYGAPPYSLGWPSRTLGEFGWDLLIAHPECTYLANCSAKNLYLGTGNNRRKVNGPDPDRWAQMGAAAAFFLALWNAPIARIAVENPIMLGHPKRLFGIPDPTQIIQPWQFGHGETKATCLWLKNLPTLAPTNIVPGREQRVFRMAPGPNRKRDRSRTYEGVAGAMAAQWGTPKAERIAATSCETPKPQPNTRGSHG